ncbi:hypothetical protein Q1695_015662 [Nippostrongylus brasiliensis]|nr:hypothetical protein Q1695_015662 [Nippostrongylus brasiliensis]
MEDAGVAEVEDVEEHRGEGCGAGGLREEEDMGGMTEKSNVEVLKEDLGFEEKEDIVVLQNKEDLVELTVRRKEDV